MKDLTVDKPSRAIFRFAVPIFIGQLFQLFYGLADTRIVGSFLGNDSLAAVSATGTLTDLIVGFLIGLTNGFSVVAARNFGARDETGLRRTFSGSLIYGTVISAVLTFLSVFFLDEILSVINIPSEHFSEGKEYISIILLGMTSAMLYNVCASILRAVGDTVRPLIFLAASSVLNIGLDLLFVAVLGFGVGGAAIATVLAQIISAILCILYIVRFCPFLHPHRDSLKPTKALTKQLFSCGISMGLMNSLVTLGTFILQGAINAFGTNIIVAHGAARKLHNLFTTPFGVFGMTMASYCSQNYGAKKYSRIKQGIRTANIFCAFWSVFVLCILHILSPVLVQLVTSTEIREVIDTATQYLRINSIFYFVTSLISTNRNALQGIGDHRTPIFSSSLELIGKYLAATLLAPAIGYMGIILAEPIVWIVMVIPLIVMMLKSPVYKNKAE